MGHHHLLSRMYLISFPRYIFAIRFFPTKRIRATPLVEWAHLKWMLKFNFSRLLQNPIQLCPLYSIWWYKIDLLSAQKYFLIFSPFYFSFSSLSFDWSEKSCRRKKVAIIFPLAFMHTSLAMVQYYLWLFIATNNSIRIPLKRQYLTCALSVSWTSKSECNTLHNHSREFYLCICV